jgi:hypothetical protein
VCQNLKIDIVNLMKGNYKREYHKQLDSFFEKLIKNCSSKLLRTINSEFYLLHSYFVISYRCVNNYV